MKRSRSIRLVLIGGISAGTLTGCGPASERPAISSTSVYTNNFYVQGVGYYHAPFRAWYQMRYNHFDPQTQRYFFGGQWAASPHQSITNVSPPTAGSVQQASAQRTDVTRSGFGSSSRNHHIWS
ncbi:MAG: hypothetical protein EXS31_16545 [Pedosphaera sp.]|nr:hypothetical protein [Pedosphaera sp.]